MYEKLKGIVLNTNMTPDVFLMMSSLSVMGPGDEKTYKPISSTDVPLPNTYYGVSKLKAETYLQSLEGFPYTIFRCTGVYGPHERDYYLMIKSIKRGFDFSVGFSKQMLTFIYVKDLVVGVMDALERGPLHKAYFISEDKAYTQQEFRKIVCSVAEWVGKVTLKASTLNPPQCARDEAVGAGRRGDDHPCALSRVPGQS